MGTMQELQSRKAFICDMEGKIKRRLMDMGIIPGREMEVQKVAPFGDPMEVKLKGYNLSLRRNEADMITVEVVPSANAVSRQQRRRFRFGWAVQ